MAVGGKPAAGMQRQRLWRLRTKPGREAERRLDVVDKMLSSVVFLKSNNRYI